MTTLWDVHGRWWPLTPVLFSVGGASLTVLFAVLTRLNPWSLLALLFVPYGLWSVREARARVRLTPDGVEVRGLRTTLLRYEAIASVEVSPAWDDGARSIWIRLQGTWSQSEPEVLTPPPEWWQAPDRSLEDVVALIQTRVDAVQGKRHP